MLTIAARAQSSKRTSYDVEFFMDNGTKDNKRNRENCVNLEDNILKTSIVPTSTNKRINRVTTISKTNTKGGIQGDYPAPHKGSIFSLKEAFGVVKEGRFKPESFHDIVTNKKNTQKISAVNNGKGVLA